MHFEIEWRDIVYSHREKAGPCAYPSFDRLADFIERKSKKANIPELQILNRCLSQTKPSGTQHFYKRENKTPRVFATNVEYSDQAVGKICSYCAKNHCINVCEDFLALNRDDALKFLSENKLCFGCADSTEHLARNCNLRSICEKCDKRHLTALHIERPTITANSKCTEVCGDSTSVVDNSMILPVWIRSKQTPNKEVLCYCIIATS